MGVRWLCFVLDVSDISFSQYHVHVLTSVMKSFFREMKEPLMTFALYSDFIQAAGLFTIYVMITLCLWTVAGDSSGRLYDVCSLVTIGMFDS